MAERADAIISRDVKAFKGLKVPCYTPQEFMDKQGWKEIDFEDD